MTGSLGLRATPRAESRYATLSGLRPTTPPLRILFGIVLEADDGPAVVFNRLAHDEEVEDVVVPEDSLLHKWFAAGDRGDLEAFDALLHPDVVVHAPLGLATSGIEAEKEVWRVALAGVPDLIHEVKNLITSGPTIAARLVVTGTHMGEFVGLAATGRRFRIDLATFAHVRDGKAAEIWEIADTASLLRQLGALG